MDYLKILSFEDFLKSVYKKFPEETLMILGSADVSPESGLESMSGGWKWTLKNLQNDKIVHKSIKP